MCVGVVRVHVWKSLFACLVPFFYVDIDRGFGLFGPDFVEVVD